MKKQYQKMTITAVPLKPEQAVLSCCNAVIRGMDVGTQQCFGTPVSTCLDSAGGAFAPSSQFLVFEKRK